MNSSSLRSRMRTILRWPRELIGPPKASVQASAPDEQSRSSCIGGTAQQFANRADRAASARRINRIAGHIDARSYLEIGVSRGVTFRDVTIERKVAVDPKFRFDVEEFRTARSEFHEITSDQYFLKSAVFPKFDVIFLDGLHQFQQTFRDFCNSLQFAHDGTVWLVDDVIPCDVYSAWPVQRESIEFRHRSGTKRAPAWHGDVYKLVFALHDFFPTLSYVTIVGSGNPQTMVWRAPRDRFSPIFDRLESIERLEYFGMLKRFEVFNARSEEEAFLEFLGHRKVSPAAGVANMESAIHDRD